MTQIAMTIDGRGAAAVGFARLHLNSARYFADQLSLYERENSSAEFGTVWERCWSYASAAIMLSFSAIEAAIFEAARDRQQSTSIDQRLSETEVQKVGKAPFPVAYKLLTGIELPTSPEPFSSVCLLHKLRKSLIHPKPNWSSDSELGAEIRRTGLPLSPFLGSNPTDTFPKAAMSAGVAQWSVTSAHEFIVAMCSKLDTPIRV